MNHKISFKFIGINFVVALFLFLPLISSAQLTTGNTGSTSSAPGCNALFAGSINNLKDIIDFAICLLTKSIVPLLLAIALLFFIYGIIHYFLNPNNIEERKKARQYMVWALIGLFVLFSVSGLVQILRTTFGVTGTPIPLLPETQ